MPAERNLPLPESAWLRTGAASRLEIELDEGSAWRLGPDSQTEISDYSRLSTGQRVTLLSLDHGLAYFTGQPEGQGRPDAGRSRRAGDALARRPRASGSRGELEPDFGHRGDVRFSSPAAEIDLREGQTTRVEPANPARFFLNQDVPAMELDRWSEARDKTLATSPSAAHVIERYGLVDLDAAGEWIQTEDLGAVWKPKTPTGWAPFQNGRWRWYDALGYTWVSGDPWGWLPYHYGRWTRMANLGWVWAPAKTAVFKPGDVYWLRGAKLAGWGPLAPGEDWNASGSAPVAVSEGQHHVRRVPAGRGRDRSRGFHRPAQEPPACSSVHPALPSPAFAASRLDATRPELRAGSTRVVPVLDGVTFQNTPAPSIVVMNPPPLPPVVVITPPAGRAADRDAERRGISGARIYRHHD